MEEFSVKHMGTRGFNHEQWWENRDWEIRISPSKNITIQNMGNDWGLTSHLREFNQPPATIKVY